MFDFLSIFREYQDLDLDIILPPNVRETLKKPLRPLWVTPASGLPSTAPEYPDYYPIILCTPSRQVWDANGAGNGEGGRAGYKYLQGAGDDSEAWAHVRNRTLRHQFHDQPAFKFFASAIVCKILFLFLHTLDPCIKKLKITTHACNIQGLTPRIYWEHRDKLLEATESELPDLISSLALRSTPSSNAPSLDPQISSPHTDPPAMVQIRPTASLYLLQPLNASTTLSFTSIPEPIRSSPDKAIMIVIRAGSSNTMPEPGKHSVPNGRGNNRKAITGPASQQLHSNSADDKASKKDNGRIISIYHDPSKRGNYRAFEAELGRLEEYLTMALSTFSMSKEPVTSNQEDASTNSTTSFPTNIQPKTVEPLILITASASPSIAASPSPSQVTSKDSASGDERTGTTPTTSPFDTPPVDVASTRDIVLATALVILCLFYDDRGKLLTHSSTSISTSTTPTPTPKPLPSSMPPSIPPTTTRPRPSNINKAYIRRRLLWLSTSLSNAPHHHQGRQQQHDEHDNDDGGGGRNGSGVGIGPGIGPGVDIKDTQPSRRILRVVHGFLMPRP